MFIKTGCRSGLRRPHSAVPFGNAGFAEGPDSRIFQISPSPRPAKVSAGILIGIPPARSPETLERLGSGKIRKATLFFLFFGAFALNLISPGTAGNNQQESTFPGRVAGEAVILTTACAGIVLFLAGRKKQEYFSELLRSLPFRCFIVDREENILFSSARDLPEIHLREGLSLADIPEKEVAQLMRKNMDDVFSDGQFRTLSFRMRGKQRVAEISRLPKRIFRSPAVLWISRDTEEESGLRKRMETLEERYFQILRNMEEGVLETDSSGKIVLMNESAEKMTGWSRQETFGRRWEDIFRTDASFHEENLLWTALRDGKSAESKGRTGIAGRNGRFLRFVSAKAFPLRGREDKITGGILLFRDTDKEYELRKNLAGALGKSEELMERLDGLASQNRLLRQKLRLEASAAVTSLKSTLDAIPYGIITINTDGKVQLLNLTAERMTGFSNQEASGIGHEEIFRITGQNGRQRLPSPAARVLRTGISAVAPGQAELAGRDGERKQIVFKASPFFDGRNLIAGAVLVFRDISAEFGSDREQIKAALRGLEYAAGLARIAWFRLEWNTGRLLESGGNFPWLWPMSGERVIPGGKHVLPEDLARHEREIEELLRNRNTVRVWDFRAFSDGKIHDYRIRASAEPSDETGPVLSGTIQDITELKNMERKCAGAIRLEELLPDDAPFPVFLEKTDDEFRIADANRAFEEFTGLPRSKISGRRAGELLTDRMSADHFRKYDGEISSCEDPVFYTGRAADGSGRLRLLKTIKIPLSTIGGERLILCASADLTRSAELDRRMNDLQRILEYGEDLTESAFFRIDPKTREIQGSGKLSELWPILDGKAEFCSAVVHPEDLARFQETWRALVSGEREKVLFDFRCIGFGETRNYRICAGVNSEAGKPVVTGILQNVTKIADKERKIFEELNLWKKIAEMTPGMFFVKDARDDFRYLHCSRSFARFLGFAPEEIAGKNDSELFPGAKKGAEMREMDEQILRTGGGCIEEDVTDAKGMERRVRTELIRYSSGPSGADLILGMSLDVTENASRSRAERISRKILAKAAAGKDPLLILEEIGAVLLEELECDRVVFTRNIGGRLKLLQETHSLRLRPLPETGIENHEKVWNDTFGISMLDRLILCENLSESREWEHFLEDHPGYPVRAFGSVPVFRDGKFHGTLQLEFTQAFHFGDAEKNLLRNISCIAALAVLGTEKEEKMSGPGRSVRQRFFRGEPDPGDALPKQGIGRA